MDSKWEEFKKHDLEEALKSARDKVDAKWRMHERQKTQNGAFVWTPENIEKIICLNDKLWALMQEADRIGKSIFNDIQKLVDAGKDYYDKNFHVEVRIIYEGKLAEDADEHALWESVESWTGTNGFDLMNKDLCGAPLNWNIIEFDCPEFKGHYFCYLMHWFFHEGLYSLQDAVTINPEEFHIYTRIYN